MNENCEMSNVAFLRPLRILAYLCRYAYSKVWLVHFAFILFVSLYQGRICPALDENSTAPPNCNTNSYEKSRPYMSGAHSGRPTSLNPNVGTA